MNDLTDTLTRVDSVTLNALAQLSPLSPSQPESYPRLRHRIKPQHERELASVKVELTEMLRQTTPHLIESGRLLIQAKRLAGHGYFLKWLNENFNMSAKTANRFMSVVQLVDRFNIQEPLLSQVLGLDLKTLYELAAKSTPLSVQQDLLDQLTLEREINYDLVRIFKRDAGAINSNKPASSELSGLTERLQRCTEWVHKHPAALESSSALNEVSHQELYLCHEKLQQVSSVIESILEQAESQLDQKPIQNS